MILTLTDYVTKLPILIEWTKVLSARTERDGMPIIGKKDDRPIFTRITSIDHHVNMVEETTEQITKFVNS